MKFIHLLILLFLYGCTTQQWVALGNAAGSTSAVKDQPSSGGGVYKLESRSLDNMGNTLCTYKNTAGDYKTEKHYGKDWTCVMISP